MANTSFSEFYSIDEGYTDLIGRKNWESDNIAVALVADAIKDAIDRSGMTYSDISGEISEIVDIVNPTVRAEEEKTIFSHDRVVFTQTGNLTGRYVFYLFGDYEAMNDENKAFGYVDLTGDGDSSSSDAEFSFIPPDDNLFDIPRNPKD